MSVAVRFPVTPAQLPEIKQIAKLLASKIAEKHPQKPLSAFKRLDAMAQGLGYLGGSDMAQSAKHYMQKESGKLQIPVENWISIARCFADCCAETPELYSAVYDTTINTLIPYLRGDTNIATMSYHLGLEAESNQMLQKANKKPC